MELIGKAANPEFWKQVREDDAYKAYREELLSFWDKDCTKTINALKYSDFRMFVVNGNRSIYESQYFLRRRILNNSAILSMVYPEEEKYLVTLMDAIYAICDEYTWCLPAHQTKLEINNNIHLDLFACETGFALAEIYTMVGDRLEPLIRDRIRVEIDRRIVTAYTNGTHYGWEKGRANWTAVCAGSVGCTFMLMHPEMVAELKPRFDDSMECYLSGFKDDGICEEGFGYWHYGFGFFTVYADMIRNFTKGETDYFKRPKVKEVARFVQKMYLSGKTTVSFSDGGRSGSYHLGLLHYLKNEYPDDITIPAPEFSYNQDACGRWCLHLRSATWLKPEYLIPEKQLSTFDYYAEGSQWLVRKNECFGFAAKAGTNAEPHNQNDVGSFIVAKNGRQMLVDMGSGRYTRQYFAPATRYGIVQCSSRGHSVPIIGGVYQHEGGAFRAKDAKYENGVFSADIAGAYDLPELKSLIRAFSFTDDTVILNDKFTYEGDGDLVERLVSIAEPKADGNGAVIIDGLTVLYDPEKYELSFSSEPMDEKNPVFFTDFKLKPGITEFSVTVKC